jgi:hypothetical protein
MCFKFYISITLLSGVNAVCTVTGLQAGHSRDHKILTGDADRLWDPSSLEFDAYQGCSLGVNPLGRETGHLPPYSADVKNMWSHTSTPTYAFTACIGTTLCSISSSPPAFDSCDVYAKSLLYLLCLLRYKLFI